MIKDATKGMSSDEKVLYEAKERFRRVEEWERDSRNNFVFDMKFCYGDSNNFYQWADEIKSSRQGDNRPCLTINKAKIHCLQVINSQRQNPSQVEFRPIGYGASTHAAVILEGIYRHIEYISNAQAAYSNGGHGQVIAGIGFWRVICDYAHDNTFDQEIYIKRVIDPLSVYLDPDIQEADGSDARFGFVFVDMTREEFELEYPKFADSDDLGSSPIAGIDGESTKDQDHVRIMEYFRKVDKVTDKWHLLDNGDMVKESEVKDADLMGQLKVNSVNSRDIIEPCVEWYLIAGGKILKKTIFPSKYIPLVRVIGEETIIDGQLDRRGHIRSLIDPQRIYNYWSSSAVEFVALQSKSPYLAPIEAIEGYEEQWARANIDNAAYLPYVSMDDAGNQISKPERAPPPMMSSAYLDGMKVAAQELQMASGQYEANMGQKSNEVSGTAVDARRRQGDVATYHFIDRFSQAIQFTGRIILDMIPRVYDTARVIKILAEDGSHSTVQLDPNAPQAHEQLQSTDDPDYNPDEVQAIFNPNVGKYEVEVDIGPAFDTKRQEGFHAMMTIVQENPSLIPIMGDLLFKSADFPLADQIADRMHNMVPPQATGKGPDPQVADLQKMLAQQHDAMQKMSQELDQTKAKLLNQSTDKDIDQYKAETQRMAAVGQIDPEAMMPVVRQLASAALGQPVNPLIAAHMKDNAQMEQRPNAPPHPDEIKMKAKTPTPRKKK